MQRQLKNLKEEVALLQGENEKLTDQAKRLRKEAQEMHEYVEKLEANEKKFRLVLNDQAMIEQD
jgi:predicted nuclease with TOPRIM domain